MPMRGITPADCARACQQLSLRVDSELSEFESVLLEAHLEGCADCRAFEQSLTAFTTTLRSVPAERPSISFESPRRRSRVDAVVATSLRAASAAAAFAVVAVSGFIALQGSNNGVTVAVAGPDLREAREVVDLHERRLEQLDAAFGGTTRRAVPRGVAAAERARSIRGTTPTRRQLATRTGQAQGRR